MKLQLMLIAGLLILSTNTFAGTKNKCDEWIAAGMSISVIEKCWERHGKSAYYLENIASDRRANEEDLAKKRVEQLQIETEKNRISTLERAIVEKRFTFLDLKREGFGVPFIAVQRTFKYKSNGDFDKTVDKTMTSGTNICKFLGFEKAKAIEVNSKEVDADQAKGKAFFIEKSSPFFGDTSYNEKPWVENSSDVVVLYLKAVTCVRSRVANNELVKSITETTRYLEADLNTGAPIISENIIINTTPRHQIELADEFEEEKDDNSDSSPFTHSSSEGQ
jgi:hypothetical protein